MSQSQQQPEVQDREWIDAIEYIRACYDDSYRERIELGANLARFACDHFEKVPSTLSSEGVLQPIQRYQDTAPDEVKILLQNKVGDDDTDAIVSIIAEFARAQASRYSPQNKCESESKGDHHV